MTSFCNSTAADQFGDQQPLAVLFQHQVPADDNVAQDHGQAPAHRRISRHYGTCRDAVNRRSSTEGVRSAANGLAGFDPFTYADRVTGRVEFEFPAVSVASNKPNGFFQSSLKNYHAGRMMRRELNIAILPITNIAQVEGSGTTIKLLKATSLASPAPKLKTSIPVRAPLNVPVQISEPATALYVPAPVTVKAMLNSL